MIPLPGGEAHTYEILQRFLATIACGMLLDNSENRSLMPSLDEIDCSHSEIIYPAILSKEIAHA